MASHNNDTVMAADVDELVDFFVFLIVCSVSARDLNAIDLSGNYVTTNTVFNLGPP